MDIDMTFLPDLRCHKGGGGQRGVLFLVLRRMLEKEKAWRGYQCIEILEVGAAQTDDLSREDLFGS